METGQQPGLKNTQMSTYIPRNGTCAESISIASQFSSFHSYVVILCTHTSLPELTAQDTTYIRRSTHETLWLLQVKHTDILILIDNRHYKNTILWRISSPIFSSLLTYLLCL